jgi:hypothetical protein
MASARPLRDVFADLIGGASATDDPDALLRDQGHPELPDHLVAEAVVNYADTAPVEVAEHLAPYVTAHSAVGADEVPVDEPQAWFDLLGTAPAGLDPAEEPVDIDDLAPAPDGFDDDAGLGTDPGLGLDFGTGADSAPVIDTADTADDADDAAGPVDDVEDHTDGGFVDIPDDLGDDGDTAGWVDADQSADTSTVDEGDGADEDDAEPDDAPLG